MKASINHNNAIFEVDLSQPIDISIPLTADDNNPIAWYIDRPQINPVVVGDWTGKVSEGSSTNFNNIFFNPHGHGTHTECLGHITKEFYSINNALRHFFFFAQVVTLQPEQAAGDQIITKRQLEAVIGDKVPEAVVIRTLPNKAVKQSKKYSNTNPPYLEEAAALYLSEKGVKHLLIDLPSVDREKDEGRLLAHKAFWNVKDVNKLNQDARHDATITEMIYVPDEAADGPYLLNLQIASFENDASPSKPILYKIL